MYKANGLGSKGYSTFRGLFLFILLSAALCFLCLSPFNSIAADPLDFLESRQECLSVPNCVSVPMKVSILRGKESLLRLTCPDYAMFFWNWDADRHRDVSITLKEESPGSVMLHIIDNDTDDLSAFRIFLGCSPEDLSERVVKFTHAASGDITSNMTGDMNQ